MYIKCCSIMESTFASIVKLLIFGVDLDKKNMIVNISKK